MPGINFQRTYHLGDAYESIKEHADKLPEAPVPSGAHTVEMDELYTLIEEKKAGSTS